ncbi:MAG: fused MFS/spermidine synthase [Gemmatimonadaceae bacterium]
MLPEPTLPPPVSRLLLAGAVFIASLCTLVIELVAGRIMAPYVGVSLYTWTSIIGVVLAGISIGAYLGGRLADRFPDRSLLGWLYLASGLAALAIGPLVDLLGPTTASDWLGAHASLMTSVLLLTAAGFFVPALLLGTVSPVVVKLAIRGLADAGSVVGRLYALSTIGSLVGTFATGFFLISWLGTRRILLIVGLVLIAGAPLFGGWLGRRRGSRAAIVALLLALVPLALALRADRARSGRHGRPASGVPAGDIYFTAESNYYTIRLARFTRADLGGEVQALYIDHLAHSFNDRGDPSFLLYDYLKVFERAVRLRSATGDSLRLLFVGGGGYTLPRLIEQRYPRTLIDVVEIDPMVTRVARDFMGLPTRTRIRTLNEDARWFMIGEASRAGRYDLIFADAFSDLSIPYHLTTREFAAQLRGRLAPGGLVLANVIDSWRDGAFMPSYLRTLETVFGKGQVGLVGPRIAFEHAERGQSTFVILASDRPLDAGALLRPGSRPEDDLDMRAVGAGDLARYLRDREGIVLTDDHAPVDNLIAPLFAERFASARR